MAFTKISIKKASFTGDTTAGNTTINNVSILNSLTPSLIVGDIVRGNGIPTDTRIVSITGSSITLDKNAIATATGVQLSTFTDDVVSKRSQGFFDAINVNTVSFDGTDDVFVPGSRINIEEPENSVPGEL